jgi:UDP-2-acetamido-3-amino-2,3-dideoxy-glucuronate N-acetyltransferase
MIFIHPSAIVESNNIGDNTKIWAFSHVSIGVRIGVNCIIGEGVYIGVNVRIGNNCKIQNHSLIYEGVEIEDDVLIGPNVVTTNDNFPRAIGEWRHKFLKTLIKKGASICANSTIVCGHTIGENAMIGAGSVVCQNIKDNYMAYGNPARHVRKIE